MLTCRSFILRIEHVPLAIDHLAVLRDPHVDAGAAFGADQLLQIRKGKAAIAS